MRTLSLCAKSRCFRKECCFPCKRDHCFSSKALLRQPGALGRRVAGQGTASKAPRGWRWVSRSLSKARHSPPATDRVAADESPTIGGTLDHPWNHLPDRRGPFLEQPHPLDNRCHLGGPGRNLLDLGRNGPRHRGAPPLLLKDQRRRYEPPQTAAFRQSTTPTARRLRGPDRGTRRAGSGRPSSP
jgi:hypothetical protein